eukprot:1162064-Pelagomonas_calceolata.AAC.10
MQARADTLLPLCPQPVLAWMGSSLTYIILGAGGAWTKGRILGPLRERGQEWQGGERGGCACNCSSRASWADHCPPRASAWYSPH